MFHFLFCLLRSWNGPTQPWISEFSKGEAVFIALLILSYWNISSDTERTSNWFINTHAQYMWSCSRNKYIVICQQTSITVQTRAGILFSLYSHPPTHSVPQTLLTNWVLPLTDLHSYTKRVIVLTAGSCSLSPTRVGLVRAQTVRPHLADIIANQSPGCYGNHNLATATWQHPTPQGIDGVSNALRGGLEGVLLSPSVQEDTRGLSFARHREEDGLPETMTTVAGLNSA